MKSTRNWLLIIAIIAIVAILGYNYIYQDHRNIEKEAPTFTMEAQDLVSEFSSDPTAAETKYLNNTIAVSGIVTESSTQSITLNDKIFCQLSQPAETTLVQGQSITIKGRVIGYDDLLEELKLDQCNPINN
ncbi:OB-fold protein [Mangrovimonas xylaniphaga]|uniref:OB-fold protein n=1 Tax=Mangrovimonas xylaniphaga TaxID=1645915 RepID=UPI0006B4C62E|nr:hypothetical protein [Mangrovimonas xylaniphaga]